MYSAHDNCTCNPVFARQLYYLYLLKDDICRVFTSFNEFLGHIYRKNTKWPHGKVKRLTEGIYTLFRGKIYTYTALLVHQLSLFITTYNVVLP